MSKLSSKQTSDTVGVVTHNPWQPLKQFTSARIALGRAGTSMPTQQSLPFQLDHARAIDAVHKALEVDSLIQQLSNLAVIQQLTELEPAVVSSKAIDRMTYLQRPDLGRQLSETSWQQLVDKREQSNKQYDLAIVVADGLSSTAIQRHAAAVIENLVTKLASDDNHPWSLAPLTIVRQGRVAVGDDVGECLKAKITVILIGERPGLSSPDSMGIYLTWNPKRGAKDSGRNCISNIRPEGLNYQEASHKAFYLLTESMKSKCTGIGLKDRSLVVEDNEQLDSKPKSHFLVSAESK